MKKIILILVVAITNILQSQCFQKVACGAEHTLIIKDDGSLWAFGANDSGEVGIGGTQHQYDPIRIGTVNDWVKVFAGTGNTSFAIKANGTLWVWGNGVSGNLGQGNQSNKYVPTQLGTSTDWDYIASGSGTIARKNDGTLWGWGSNIYGQLNLGTNSLQLTPVQISIQTDWNKIVGGDNHFLLLKNNGTLWASGLNDFGQIGDGTTTNKLNFTQIGTDTDWVEIAAEFKHSLAIKANGTLWGWGSNINNLLGLPSNISNVTVPTQIDAATNWSKIDTGYYATKGIKTDGTLWYLTASGSQQLTTENDWNFIDSGQAFFFVMKNNGTLWGVGGNDYGQLGLGVAIQGTAVPLQLNCSALLNVEELNSLINFKVYPNPTNDLLLIENSSNIKIDSIKLADITGKKILDFTGDTSKINLQSFENGIYILFVISENKIYNYKIVKQ